MADISPTLINEIYSNINNKIKENYINSFFMTGNSSDDKNKDTIYREYILEFIIDNFKDKKADTIFDIKSASLYDKNRTKKRWLSYVYKDIENNNPKTIVREFQAYQNLIDINGIDYLATAFKVNSLGELKINILQELELWCFDNNSYLSSFRYLKTKSKNQILKAFELDLLYEISSIVIDKWSGNLNNYITETPEMVNNAYFSSQKIALAITNQENVKDNLVLYNDFEVSEDYIIRTIISNKPSDDIQITGYYSLDDKDCSLINFALSKRDELFLTNKILIVDIGEAVAANYSSRNSGNYTDVEKRLVKIKNYSIEGIVKKNQTKNTVFSISFFQSVIIETDEITNKRYARIVCSDMLHQQYINSQTIKMYSSQIKSFEYNLSKILIHIMQKERLDCCNEDCYEKEYLYDFFKTKIRFKSRKQDINMDLIEESLCEFKQKNIVIQEYKRFKNYFVIKYIPLNYGEKYDFLGLEA